MKHHVGNWLSSPKPVKFRSKISISAKSTKCLNYGLVGLCLKHAQIIGARTKLLKRLECANHLEPFCPIGWIDV